MKKQILAALILAAAALATAQTIRIAESTQVKSETVTATNGTVTVYLGLAKSYQNIPAAGESSNAWRIIRTTYDTNGVFTGSANAYATGYTNTALWANTWTNRVNATYK